MTVEAVIDEADGLRAGSIHEGKAKPAVGAVGGGGTGGTISIRANRVAESVCEIDAISTSTGTAGGR